MKRYFILLSIALTAAGARADASKNCQSLEDPDRQIRSCTLVIERHQDFASTDATTAYLRRGEAYLAKRDYEPAIADFTMAITLNPRDAQAYAARARAHFLSLDIDAAETDSKNAIERAPSPDASDLNWSMTYTAE
jgi:tetratricopeptide (TPR) repeat protein